MFATSTNDVVVVSVRAKLTAVVELSLVRANAVALART
jgi:hypothetical protein